MTVCGKGKCRREGVWLFSPEVTEVEDDKLDTEVVGNVETVGGRKEEKLLLV